MGGIAVRRVKLRPQKRGDSKGVIRQAEIFDTCLRFKAGTVGGDIKWVISVVGAQTLLLAWYSLLYLTRDAPLWPTSYARLSELGAKMRQEVERFQHGRNIDDAIVALFMAWMGRVSWPC